jgi:hypothetical protein
MAKHFNHGLENPLFDTRIVERNVRLGIVDEKQYEEHLKNLADDENNAEYIEIVDETTADADADAEENADTPERLTFT